MEAHTGGVRITQHPSPPTGWKRRFLRMPVTLYRWHLGGLFGHRFVLLEHVGRRSGKTRQVGHGAPDGWIVAGGYGTTSDWCRNLTAHPRARVQAGRNIRFVRLRPVHR